MCSSDLPMSTRPQYNSKIRAMYALAPVAFLGHMLSPLLTPFAREAEGVFDVLQNCEFLPRIMGRAIHGLGSFV